MPNDRGHILHIDDDPALANLVARALGRRGYAVAHAGSSEIGLERLAHDDAFDAIVLDHFLPTGTGLDFLTATRSLPHRPPVVYVTGADDAAVAVAALKAGAGDYVIKTVGEEFFELLASAVDQAIETARLQYARDRAEIEVREARDRAEILLHEVNHRVANSLSLVAALVTMQAKAVDDPAARSALEQTHTRIAAIAGVHRCLYTSDDVRSVEISDYLTNLLRDLETTLMKEGHSANARIQAEQVELGTDKAVSLGMIVTELVTNAFKYAYPNNQGGEIRVRLQKTNADRMKLTVQDDGVGWNGVGPIQGTGMGTRIINALAKNLGSAVTYASGRPGCEATLEFAL
ncbi:MAG TPA: histidine kinase dimerization/phosphoacceptor domain -containing protein [Stellaceae bacterium]|jgi:two-component sensor histidine kinase|nr:histidine kinase dimerization/phosphoacceptor domain -containing protein [Stellaceae bacterium]